MRRAAALLISVLLPAALHAEMAPLQREHSNYLLNCGGCHGIDGVSNSRIVPDLKDQVGYFLQLPEGRRYLGRLPNIAFATLSDRELADLLNYMVFILGGDSAPKDAKPYTVQEVASLRKQPLNEVALFEYRAALVEELIEKHNATTALRLYGEDLYGSGKQ